MAASFYWNSERDDDRSFIFHVKRIVRRSHFRLTAKRSLAYFKMYNMAAYSYSVGSRSGTKLSLLQKQVKTRYVSVVH